MPTRDRDNDDPSRGASCRSCGASFAADQRYCLECGARRGELPAAVAAQVAVLAERGRGGGAGAPVDGAATEPVAAAWFPSPRAAAVAVMTMLALGVIIGSATSQVAESAGLQPIVLQLAEEEAPAPVEEEAIAAAPTEFEAPAEPAPATVLPEEVIETPLPEEPLPEEPTEAPAPLELPPELEEEELLPEVKHLFVVMLGENGYEEAFGKTSAAPYLAKVLPEQGELISNYYAVAKGRLANEIALLSGQGPTPETSAECPVFADVVPGTESAEGQIEGNGCIYPAGTESLPGQLEAKGLSWKAYAEEAVPGVPDPPSCGRPFGYFHALLDKPECMEDHYAGLPALEADLKDPKVTPTLSYVLPDACHSGGVTPCALGAPTGPVATEEFLKTVVAEIVKSKAYAEGGLIAITSAEAPQSGPALDESSCCGNPEYPNLPPPASAPVSSGPVKPNGGGGRVGLLLLSKFVKPGTVNESSYYNHYSLLLTIEELFELEPLGYAAEPVLTGFDTTVFNAISAAGEEGESTVVERAP